MWSRQATLCWSTYKDSPRMKSGGKKQEASLDLGKQDLFKIHVHPTSLESQAEVFILATPDSQGTSGWPSSSSSLSLSFSH